VPITTIRTPEGAVKRFLHLRTPLTADDVGSNFTVRIISKPTQLDNVSFDAAEKERQFWVVAEVNEILFPLDIPEGTSLIVPSRRFFDEL